MNTTIANSEITVKSQTTTFTESKEGTKKKSDSLEFLSGVFYIFKKVFLLR